MASVHERKSVRSCMHFDSESITLSAIPMQTSTRLINQSIKRGIEPERIRRVSAINTVRQQHKKEKRIGSHLVRRDALSLSCARNVGMIGRVAPLLSLFREKEHVSIVVDP